MDATRSNSSKLDATAPKFGGPMAKWISMAAAVPLFPGDAMPAKEKTLTKKSEDRRRQRARRKLARTVSDALSAAAVATAAAVSALATTSVSSASSAAFAVTVRAPSPALHGVELEDENQHGTAAAAAALAEEDEEDEVNDEVDVDDEAAMDDEAEWYDEAVLADEVEQHTGAEKIGERAGTVAIANSTVLTFATGDTRGYQPLLHHRHSWLCLRQGCQLAACQLATSTHVWGGTAVGGSVALDLAARGGEGHGRDELRHGRREPVSVAARRAGGAAAAASAPRDHIAHRLRYICHPSGGGGGRSRGSSDSFGSSSSSSSRSSSRSSSSSTCRHSGLAQETPQAPSARVRLLLAAPLLAGILMGRLRSRGRAPHVR